MRSDIPQWMPGFVAGCPALRDGVPVLGTLGSCAGSVECAAGDGWPTGWPKLETLEVAGEGITLTGEGWERCTYCTVSLLGCTVLSNALLLGTMASGSPSWRLWKWRGKASLSQVRTRVEPVAVKGSVEPKARWEELFCTILCCTLLHYLSVHLLLLYCTVLRATASHRGRSG